MVLETLGKDIVLSDFEHFDIKQTMDCGQCFRFDIEEKRVKIFAFNRELIVDIEENGNYIFRDITEEEFNRNWRAYFDLDFDYGSVFNTLVQDETLKKAAVYAPGIRILNQDTYEALCSFIISQNNNIPRIKGIISRLCMLCGEKVFTDENGNDIYSFPTPEAMAKLTVTDLAPIRSGFRAKYLVDAATKVASGELDLDAVAKMPIEDAREALMTIKGVGPKVAECVLLFGMHRLEAFPMDVWMKRAMAFLFPNGLPDYATEYGGIAQQYIFHYSRQNSEIFKEEQ